MKIKLACAPINWSNDDLPALGGDLTYQQCLSEMALAGFIGTEGGCKYPKDHKILKKALDLRSITLCNMWFSTNFTNLAVDTTKKDLVTAFKHHLDYTYALGARVVGVGECGVTIHPLEAIPLIGKRPILTQHQLDLLTEGLNLLGQLANEKRMKLCFHPHVGTGVQSSEEVDFIMNNTDPDKVGLLFDTGHTILAGEDPVKLLSKYIDRVVHMHFKDVRGSVLAQMNKHDWSFLYGIKQGIFTVPGDGDQVNWEDIFKIIKSSDYSGWIVIEAEQDPDKADPLEYAMIARKFLKENLGV